MWWFLQVCLQRCKQRKVCASCEGATSYLWATGRDSTWGFRLRQTLLPELHCDHHPNLVLKGSSTCPHIGFRHNLLQVLFGCTQDGDCTEEELSKHGQIYVDFIRSEWAVSKCLFYLKWNVCKLMLFLTQSWRTLQQGLPFPLSPPTGKRGPVSGTEVKAGTGGTFLRESTGTTSS